MLPKAKDQGPEGGVGGVGQAPPELCAAGKFLTMNRSEVDFHQRKSLEIR